MGSPRNNTKRSLLTNFMDLGHKWEFIVYWRQCPFGYCAYFANYALDGDMVTVQVFSVDETI